MKNLMSLSKLFLAMAVIFFASSCDPDDAAPIVINPTSSFEIGDDFISESATIDPGTSFTVRISASSGDNEMNTLTIKQDGDNVDATRLTGDVDNNPQLLFDADRSSFVYDITIAPHDAGTATYEFIVASETAGDDNVLALDITIAEVVTVLDLTVAGDNVVNLTEPTVFGLALTAVQGSSPLSSIEVHENGTLIADAARLRYGDATTAFDTNPYFLPEEDKAGFAKTVYIATPAAFGSYNYDIILTDEAGMSITLPYTININAPATNLTAVFPNVPLFNNSGSGFGTINLDLGTNETSVNNPDADILDSGNVGGVWDRTIAPINGAALRILSDQSFYTYDGIASREELVAAWDEASGDLDSSGTIVVGSTYMARVGAADYYVFTCTAVNDSGSANTQNYVFDIKQSKL